MKTEKSPVSFQANRARGSTRKVIYNETYGAQASNLSPIGVASDHRLKADLECV
jgi:hypothetical protein